MKTFNPRINFPKNLILLAMLSTLLFSTACEKASVKTMEEPITTEETVALVEAALVSGAEGITNELEDAIYAAELVLEKTLTNVYCGVNKDSTLSRNFSSARFSGQYNTSWQWILNCNEQEIPTSLDFKRKATGDYESLRLLSNDEANGTWSMSNLVTGTAYLFNGSYIRKGNQQSKVREQKSFTSTVEFNLTGLSVGKIKRQITDGTATLLVSGQSSSGESFSITGSVDFLGDGAAVITINGQSYPIDLY
ncbi:MAG: hypothetical protein R2828_05050 [Saprospiraceae bacterium]